MCASTFKQQVLDANTASPTVQVGADAEIWWNPTAISSIAADRDQPVPAIFSLLRITVRSPFIQQLFCFFDVLFRGWTSYLEGCGFICLLRRVTADFNACKLPELQPIPVLSVHTCSFIPSNRGSPKYNIKTYVSRVLRLCQTFLRRSSLEERLRRQTLHWCCWENVSVLFSTWRRATVQQFRGAIVTPRLLHPEMWERQNTWCPPSFIRFIIIIALLFSFHAYCCHSTPVILFGQWKPGDTLLFV